MTPVRRIDGHGLASLLSPSLGDTTAHAVVTSALEVLRLSPNQPLTVSQALSVLEHIAQRPGIVGVAARFAKSRVHLMGG